MNFFESHAHYDDEAFDTDRDALLSSLPASSIGIVINSGASLESSVNAAELSKRYPYIYSAAGVHPHYVGEMNENDIDALAGLCGHDKTVAIGEIGLDYYRDLSPRDAQKKWFIEQINLAVDKNLPIIVHSREADEDTFNIVKNTDAKKVGGVVHCFSGSWEMAAEYIRLGFYIGVGGVVTYSNAKRLIEVVRKIPFESLLIETDCPYLSPEPFRGKRNDSRNLKYIVSKIAEIKGVTEDDAAAATFANGLRLFGIKGWSEYAQ